MKKGSLVYYTDYNQVSGVCFNGRTNSAKNGNLITLNAWYNRKAGRTHAKCDNLISYIGSSTRILCVYQGIE